MHQHKENNRDRVLKAYCAERLKGFASSDVAPAVDAARAVVVGRVKPDRFQAWCREAETMCQEEFGARDFVAKRKRAERNALSTELLALHRKNPWHGAAWRDGVEALIAVHGEPLVNEVWSDCLEYLREQRS